MSGDQGVNDDGRADERKWDEGETNFRPSKILRRDGAELRADSSARVHDQRNENVDIAFDRVSKRSVTRRNDDFEKIGPYREVGRYSKNVNHRRHADITGAAAKESAAQSTDERDQQDDPKRDGDAGFGSEIIGGIRQRWIVSVMC